MGRPKRQQIEYRLKPIGEWYYICWSENRKPKRVSTRTRDEEAAKGILANFKAGLTAAPNYKQITISMITAEYRAAKNDGSRAYTGTLCNAMQHIDAFFGPLMPENITPALSRQYIADRRALGRADDTIRRELGALQAAINYCKREGWKITSSPIILPPPSPARDIWLGREDVKRLIECCEQDHLRLFILIAYTTCARKASVLELTWDRVNMQTRLIDFRTPKERETNKRRGVKRINNRLFTEMEKALELAQSNYVIEWNGKPVGNIRKAFMTAAAKADLPLKVTPHTLKHSAGVHMAMDGVPIMEISKQLDHTSVRTTERHYMKYHPEFMVKAANALERI